MNMPFDTTLLRFLLFVRWSHNLVEFAWGFASNAQVK